MISTKPLSFHQTSLGFPAVAPAVPICFPRFVEALPVEIRRGNLKLSLRFAEVAPAPLPPSEVLLRPFGFAEISLAMLLRDPLVSSLRFRRGYPFGEL